MGAAPVREAVALRIERRPRSRASGKAAGEADKTNAEGAEMAEVRGEETWFEPKESPPRSSAALIQPASRAADSTFVFVVFILNPCSTATLHPCSTSAHSAGFAIFFSHHERHDAR